MPDNGWDETIFRLKKELMWVEASSRNIGSRFKSLQLQAESLKIEFLKHSLEKQRKASASRRGLNLMVKDRKKMGVSLAAAAGGSILIGILTGDKYAALKAGLSTFDGVKQRLGETVWAVSLGEDLSILPESNITAGKTWVTWESLQSASAQLEIEASQGVELGNLESIISSLQGRKELIYLHPSATKRTWVKVESDSGLG